MSRIKSWWIPLIAVALILAVAVVLVVIGVYNNDEADVGPDQQPTRTGNP